MDTRTVEFWKGKRIFITGTTSGLGEAVVEALSHLPVTIGMFSRNAEKLAQMEAQLADRPAHVWWQAGDVRHQPGVEQAVKAFTEFAGGLDVVWANSGISLDTRQIKWNWDVYHTMIETNLHGAIYTIQAGLTAMGGPGKAKGHVVGIGSVASTRGLPGRGIYSLTKIGLTYYMESLVAEFPDVQFHIIHPGFVDTPINRGNPNRFWLMMPPQAAEIMLKGVSRGKKRIIYPWQMKIIYHLVHCLPEPLYYSLVRKMGQVSIPRGERQDPDKLFQKEPPAKHL